VRKRTLRDFTAVIPAQAGIQQNNKSIFLKPRDSNERLPATAAIRQTLTPVKGVKAHEIYSSLFLPQPG
jgi:hypothetical protein